MSVLDQNGRIYALGFLSWLGPLQLTQPITTFLSQLDVIQCLRNSPNTVVMKMADRAMKNVFYGVNFSIILGTVHSTTTRQASFSHTHKENRLDRRCVHYTQIAAAQQDTVGQKVLEVEFNLKL
jgi:hypothetical protein